MYPSQTIVVDGVYVTVGSATFDNRSFSINDEDALNVIDAKVAADFERAFETDLKQSRPIDPEKFLNRSVFIRMSDEVCGLLRSQF